jgi:hypothetical protein
MEVLLLMAQLVGPNSLNLSIMLLNAFMGSFFRPMFKSFAGGVLDHPIFFIYTFY